jgi:hypothetical protein
MKTIIKALDITGGFTSLLCALHCLAIPFIIAILPSLGFAWLGSHAFGLWMLAITFTIGLFAIIQGFQEHRNCLPLVKLGIGLLCLVLGEIVLHEMICEQPIRLGQRVVMAHVKGHPWHSFVSAFGGFMVVFAHILNRILCKRTCKTCCHE